MTVYFSYYSYDRRGHHECARLDRLQSGRQNKEAFFADSLQCRRKVDHFQVATAVESVVRNVDEAADARRNTEKKRREERTTARVAYVKRADPAPWPPQHELNNVDAAHKRAIRSTEKEAAFERIRVQEVDRRRAREREMADAAARLQALRIGDAIVGDNILPIRDALP
eukprot:scaffold3167_cov105-Isochrysis_galbana.AAC.6